MPYSRLSYTADAGLNASSLLAVANTLATLTKKKAGNMPEFLKEVAQVSAWMSDQHTQVVIEPSCAQKFVPVDPGRMICAAEIHTRTTMRNHFNRICRQVQFNLAMVGRSPFATLRDMADNFVARHPELSPIVQTAMEKRALRETVQGIMALHFINAAALPYKPQDAKFLIKHCLVTISEERLCDRLLHSARYLTDLVEELPPPLPRLAVQF